MTEWWEPYLDLPFLDHGRTREGVDCWGLVRMVWQEQRGITLPAWDAYADIRDRPAIGSLLARAIAEFDVIEQPQPFAIALFRSSLSVFHVGVMVDAARMLDIEKEAGVWVRPWEALRPQLKGFYWPRIVEP